jgi:hypothetical protein
MQYIVEDTYRDKSRRVVDRFESEVMLSASSLARIIMDRLGPPPVGDTVKREVKLNGERLPEPTVSAERKSPIMARSESRKLEGARASGTDALKKVPGVVVRTDLKQSDRNVAPLEERSSGKKSQKSRKAASDPVDSAKKGKGVKASKRGKRGK